LVRTILGRKREIRRGRSDPRAESRGVHTSVRRNCWRCSQTGLRRRGGHAVADGWKSNRRAAFSVAPFHASLDAWPVRYVARRKHHRAWCHEGV